MKKDKFYYRLLFDILDNSFLKLLLVLLTAVIITITHYKLDSILRHWLE